MLSMRFQNADPATRSRRRHAWRYGLAALLLAMNASPAAIAQLSPANDFVPDVMFTGSTLNAQQAIGTARWSAANGVISADARHGPGLMPLDFRYQDLELFARFRCKGPCDAGIVLRFERTPGGATGIMLGLEGNAVGRHLVTFDPNGKLLTKERLVTPKPKIVRVDLPPPPADTKILERYQAALSAPVRIAAEQWNTISLVLDANQFHAHLNRIRNSVGGPVPVGTGKQFAFGPVALYAGSGTVSFDQLGFKDLLHLAQVAPQSSRNFSIQRLTEFYYSWGAAIGDVNRDGIKDVVAGPFYYLGPDFLKRGEIYDTTTVSAGGDYATDMINFVYDFTGDGWPDILTTEFRPMVLYINPGLESRRWQRVEALPQVCSEVVVSRDLNGDGVPEIIFLGRDGRVNIGRPDPKVPLGPWHVIGIGTPIVAGCHNHGLGAGDVDGDGRTDIVTARGWFEQPPSGIDGGWTFHEVKLGALTRSPQHPGGGEMSVTDLNGDGLADIATSMSAHGWGLAWFEQQRDAKGAIHFVQHDIMGDYSQQSVGGVVFAGLHSGATAADIDGDGVDDLIVGKRHWSHLDSWGDPDPQAPAVVYVYHTVRKPDAPGGVTFVPELVDNRSGLGSQVSVGDIDGDGKPDFVSSGTRGAFIFWNHRKH